MGVLNRVFKIRAGEAGLVFTLGFLLLSNAVAYQISDIVAVSGFLSEGGVNQILIVWVVDSVLIFLATGLQSLIIDRFDRPTLIKWLVFGLAFVFTILRLLFTFKGLAGFNYALLYLVAEQQLLFFPLVFWVLANDVFNMSQSKRLFPVIASLSFIGKLIGIGVALVSPNLFASLNIDPNEVLLLNVVIYLVSFIVVVVGLRKADVRETRQQHETVRETLMEGWGFVREVLSFRFLAISIIAMLVCDTVIEFRFLTVTNARFGDPVQYQTFYSWYRLGLLTVSFLVQGLLTSRIIAVLTLKKSFFIKPISVLIGALSMILKTNLLGSVIGIVLLRLPQYTVDESSHKAFQALVPEERRGRVSIFMDSYLYCIGVVIGCFFTGAIVLIGILSGFENYFYFYLGLAVLASLVAIWAVFKMRGVYDISLFNWRLKRRQRRGLTGVMDKLEF
jgi:ATP:ADP antiporter, AAA family